MKKTLCNFMPKIPALQNTSTVYNINYKDCDSVYIAETGQSGNNIRLKQHKYAYKSGNSQLKLVNHSTGTNHIPDFKIIKSN